MSSHTSGMLNSDEIKQLTARAEDYAKRASYVGFAVSDFLSPYERSVIEMLNYLKKDYDISFYGGYDEAERTLAVFTMKGEEYIPSDEITVIYLEVRGGEVSHRDILGSVMAMGITRAKTGDIITGKDAGYLICKTEISAYILDNLERIGRCTVRTSVGTLENLSEPETSEKSFTVMSPRLDAVVSEGFSISRTKAADYIKGGICFHNWKNELSASKAVGEGDVITLRGFGRIKISAIGGQSRKGRTFITVLIYK